MSTANTNESESQVDAAAADGGYGTPTPEQELPEGVDSVESTTDVNDDVSLDDDGVDDVDTDAALNEVPDDAATNPGSPDPTLAGDESGEAALQDDKSLGAPDRNFFQAEDSGSDGEPGAGRFGGTDDQLHEELSSVDAGAQDSGAQDSDSAATGEGSIPAETPSSDAPLTDGNTSDSERGPLSSESDADASGEPV